ncbi:FadR/GntR family transcriptional regulator [Marivita hallyeonensis]|uniref:Transcriptional regulator, GntR family n=1 Tax=Marivita hallyeonensis TaxID=996342 RepID=A0A1M5S3C1_9RHOB|nr:FCD domain-containing protein [Marivita hallyeonensis]SHH32979.1 transcriptional regulator, GntR family [Marivita hallyeonensis]
MGPRAKLADDLERVSAHLDELGLGMNDQLPVERTLAANLGISRDRLRKVLGVLEDDGKIWRQVGRGTFIGPRPVLNLADVAFLGDHSSPREVIQARIAIEPSIAALAATYATQQDLKEIKRCARMCRKSEDWRGYEVWDLSFHRAIARATRNQVLIHLFETLNLVRRTSSWQIRRSTPGPLPDYASFDEHDEICRGIELREEKCAADALRRHLATVEDRITRQQAT